MRIEFRKTFSDSIYEQKLITDFDSEWKKIGVYFLWHIGENFAEGFFEDFNNLKITFEEIVESSKIIISNYNEKILSVIFKEVN
ncbi:TPA: hypothetical protein ACGGHC_002726 [Flavobacterium psychrophilum]